MAIWLDVNPRSGVPIYVQIIDGVKRALEVGSLQPGDRLPTVRQLSSTLTIAPNTIVKAYSELQRLGLIECRTGVGTVVSATVDGDLRKRQISALYERFHLLVRDALNFGLEPHAIEDRLKMELSHFDLEHINFERDTTEITKKNNG